MLFRSKNRIVEKEMHPFNILVILLTYISQDINIKRENKVAKTPMERTKSLRLLNLFYSLLLLVFKTN